jgi:hypothetical protein
VSLRMLAHLRLAELRMATAQQRSTGHNLPSDLYSSVGIATACRLSKGDVVQDGPGAPPTLLSHGYRDVKLQLVTSN